MKLSQKLKLVHDSGDCGGYLEGFTEMAEALENSKPKIKMTKTLPCEAGYYYWASGYPGSPVTIIFCHNDGDVKSDNGYSDAADVGGYWAKVDESMFEFEGE